MEAYRLLRAQDYAAARRLLDELIQQKPNSPTALALRGDATLFDEALGSREAARQAREHYDRASQLLGQGCRVQRRTEYYLRMGEAFVALRLAAHEEGRFDAAELDHAERVLKLVEERWPESAEVHYHLARVFCARGDHHFETCAQHFQQALDVAENLDRPRFLRTHRSTEDWIVRAETQSEFRLLRADPRYGAIIARARAGSRHRRQASP